MKIRKIEKERSARTDTLPVFAYVLAVSVTSLPTSAVPGRLQQSGPALYSVKVTARSTSTWLRFDSRCAIEVGAFINCSPPSSRTITSYPYLLLLSQDQGRVICRNYVLVQTIDTLESRGEPHRAGIGGSFPVCVDRVSAPSEEFTTSWVAPVKYLLTKTNPS